MGSRENSFPQQGDSVFAGSAKKETQRRLPLISEKQLIHNQPGEKKKKRNLPRNYSRTLFMKETPGGSTHL